MGFKTLVTSPRWWNKGHWPHPPTKTNNYTVTQEQKQFWGSFQNRQQHSETKNLGIVTQKGKEEGFMVTVSAPTGSLSLARNGQLSCLWGTAWRFHRMQPSIAEAYAMARWLGTRERHRGPASERETTQRPRAGHKAQCPVGRPTWKEGG